MNRIIEDLYILHGLSYHTRLRREIKEYRKTRVCDYTLRLKDIQY